MEENNVVNDKLIAKMTMQLGILTAQNIELNVIIEDLKEQNLQLNMKLGINEHVESLKKENEGNE